MDSKKIFKKPEITLNPILTIANKLLESRTVAHIIHLQAKNKSYAEHIALGEYYETIGELIDDLVEKSFSEYGIITGYNICVDQSKLTDPISYILDVRSCVIEARNSVTSPYIQQMIDNIIEQLSHTHYKLINLK